METIRTLIGTRWLRTGVLVLLASCLFGCSLLIWVPSGTSLNEICDRQQPQSPEASSIVQDIRNRFVLQSTQATSPAPAALSTGARPALGESAIHCIRTEGDYLHAVTNENDRFTPARLDVVLPARAGGAFRIADPSTDFSVQLHIENTSPAAAEIAEGYIVYREALGPGSAVLCGVTSDRLEDFIWLRHQPESPAVRYRIRLPGGVAGLRLIANTLEVVDEMGTPRIRLGTPYVVDATNQRHEALLSIEGCAVDTSAAPPWGRAVVPAGSDSCVIRMGWSATIPYPILIDPHWSSTKDMAFARQGHTATNLLDGRVLVVGGFGPTNILSSAEVYDPASSTWASVASIPAVIEVPALGPRPGRALHAAALLPSGSVLVVGGADDLTHAALAATIVFDAAAGTWRKTQSAGHARLAHTATILKDGKVLVVGGFDSFNASDVSETESFDPTTELWTSRGTTAARRFHSAGRLSDGRVLVVGGITTTGSVALLNSTALFEPATDAWTAGPPLAIPRRYHTQTQLGDGTVLITGGESSAGTSLVSVERLVGGAWSNAADLLVPRSAHTATLLKDGRVLLTGGSSLREAEVFDPPANKSLPAGKMSVPRVLHSASFLASGRILVAGGAKDSAPTIVATSELFQLGSGDKCTVDADCDIGTCVDNVCCDSTCGYGAYDCMACSVAAGGMEDGKCTPAHHLQTCTAVHANGLCSDGMCSFIGCDPGFGNCDALDANGCEVDLNLDSLHCGSCTNPCGVGRSCAGGVCCLSGFGNCDGNSKNGCETNLSGDINNCGTCGSVCMQNHSAIPLCQAGNCSSPSCFGSFASCDGNNANGCETDIATDPKNCGGCGQSCSTNHIATPTCNTIAFWGIVCGAACDPGWVDCNNDKLSDGCEALELDNCGACGQSCSGQNVDRSCHAGKCDGTCHAGFADCNADKLTDGCEVSILDDVLNCGSCNHACSSSTMINVSCVAASCSGTCAPGFADCNGNLDLDGCETNIASDPDNCGACGSVCSSNHIAFPACSQGLCVGTCAAGFEDCDSLASNGCEKNVTDPDFCTTCGWKCNDGNGCTMDACLASGCSHFTNSPCGNGICSRGKDGCLCPADCKDSDGDGLSDGWETSGVDTNCDGIGDFPLPGAKPLVKDLYLELDYMVASDHTHKPDPSVIAETKAYFAAQGINLHVEVNEALEHHDLVAVGTSPSCSTLDDPAFGDQIAYSKIRDTHMDPRRKGLYRYGVIAHAYNRAADLCSVTRTGGVATSNVGFVLLGTGAALMHELGHTLGLQHGGGDDIPYKPNYFSAMGGSGGTMLTPTGYSIRKLDTLKESGLNETVGINSPETATVRYSCPPTCAPSTPDQCQKCTGSCSLTECLCVNARFAANVSTDPIDWNCNGAIESSPVSADINYLGSQIGGSGILDLIGFDDWHNLSYCLNGLGTLPLPVEDIPNEEVEGGSDFGLVPPIVISIEPKPSTIFLGQDAATFVAILAQGNIDLSTIDVKSLRFALAPLVSHDWSDVDGNGAFDLVAGFSSRDLRLIPQSTIGVLTGRTVSGRPIQGQATIKVIPPAVPAAPVAKCASISVSAGVQCTQAVSIDAGTHDQDGDQVRLVQSPPGPYRLGTTQVTLTASDLQGSTTCQGTVTVVDTTPPEMKCPEPLRLECRKMLAATSDVTALTTDCSQSTVACEPSPGQFTLGDSVGTCVAVDAVGNRSSCDFSVTVADTQPPSFALQSRILVSPERARTDVRGESAYDFHIEQCVSAITDACVGDLPVEGTVEITRVELHAPLDKLHSRANRKSKRSTVACPGPEITTPTTAVLPIPKSTDDSASRFYEIAFRVKDPFGNSAESSCRVRFADASGDADRIPSKCEACVGAGCGGCPHPTPCSIP